MDIGSIIAGRDPSDILTCTPDISLRDAVDLLAGRRVGALPVMEDGAVAGIVSERDVIYCIAAGNAGCLDRPVREVMTAPAITVTPDTEIDDALALMTRRRIRHLPVIEDRRFAGFVSIGDLVKTRFAEVQKEAEQMRTYIQTA